MRDDVASLVYPIIVRGQALKERLDRGDKPDLVQEQAKLKGLLNADVEGRRPSDFVGEASLDPRASLVVSGSIDPSRRGSEQFLGIRYALVCWLDELFSGDNRWGEAWNNMKLETSLYSSNDRAWKFWEQARRAEGRNTDAIEGFFLCVMLGFRGNLREQPEQLQTWVNANQSRISKGQGQEWPMPAELEPPSNVPPLRGREKMQQMILVGGVFLLIAVPIVTLFIILQG